MSMRDFLTILRRNFVSVTFITIFVLALILLALGERRDALFISGVIMINTAFAVIQELRAKRELKKLELLTAPRARLIDKDGKAEEVSFDVLKTGDEIQIQVGDEVPADGKIILSSGLEVDESILTGESASIEKPTGTIVKAASIVVAGNAIVRVSAVGKNSMAGKMTATLKRYKPSLTPTQQSISTVITWLAYAALILSALIYITYSFYGYGKIRTFKTITSSAVAIVPEGLLLASTVLLAYGSVKLAKAKVLPQKIAAIEAMALLNVLCVDKTGTLTSDEISFDKFESFDETIKNLPELVGVVAKETGSGSATGEAVVMGLPVSLNYDVLQTLAFSSARKMSGVKFKSGNKKYSLLMGAPEFVSLIAPLSDEHQEQIALLTKDGKRVLLVGMLNDFEVSFKKLEGAKATAVGIVVLNNNLRKGVKKTVKFLQGNGVSLRVISGDNPNTVSYIAQRAGINDSQKIITGAELKNLTGDEWDNAVLETTIFARVLPKQKERIIMTFKKYGNFTGMVGDGVNDALAIKTSDLGVAMFDGATATRRVADIVLMDNSFNSLPLGMRLGNRVIQAIELIAMLFFHKIIQWVVLLTMTLVFGQVYPFLPRHLTFMNVFLVTLPTIIWTVYTPIPRSRLSPKYFWRDTLLAILPIAILSGLTLSFTYIYLQTIHPFNQSGVSTTTVIVATIIGVYMAFLAPMMFDIKQTKKTFWSYAFYAVASLTVACFAFGVGFLRDFFDFTMPAWQNTWPLVVVLIGVVILQWKVAVDIGHRLANRTTEAK